MNLSILLQLSNPKRLALTMLTMAICITGANAQDTKPLVTYGFKTDTIDIKANQTFSNTFWIANYAQKPVKLVLAELQESAKKGLLRLPDTIILQPEERRSFPIKYMADRYTIDKAFQEFRIKLREISNGISVQTGASFYARSQNIRGLFIDTDQQEVYLNQITNQARLMVRVINRNLFPIDFNLIMTEIPEGLEFVGEASHMTIQPGAQLYLPFIAKNKLNSSSPADFTVTIQATDNFGHQLATKRIRIMSLSSDRRLSLNQTPFYYNKPNTVALRYSTVDKSFSSYQLQGNGIYDLKDGESISYQLNSDYFNNPGQKGLNISDSYLSYQNKDWGVKIGNIYENLDYNLSGRGVKATANLSKSKSFDVYTMNNNFMLYSDFHQQKQGNTFALVYREDKDINDNKKVTYLLSENLMNSISTSLLSGTFNFPISKQQNIGFDLGYGKQSLKEAGPKDQNGSAIGFRYNLNLKDLTFRSNNYYSTPYYAGLRKGFFQTDNMAWMRLNGQHSINARINIIDNKPKFLSVSNLNYLPVTNNYGSSTYEIGYGYRIKNWNFQFTPYYFSQFMQNQESKDPNAEFWKSESLRAKANIQYRISDHEFSLDTDNGYTFKNTSERPPSPYFSSRVNFTYRNQIFGLTAFSQHNSYFLSDALGVSANPKYSIYSIGPNARFALLNRRLTVNANTMYNYYGFSNNKNYTVNTNVRWLLKNQWAISGDFFYGVNRVQSSRAYDPVVGVNIEERSQLQDYVYRYDNKQMRIGIEKGFGRAAGDRDMKMEMNCFEDRNANGFRDENEPYLSDIVVKVSGLAAVTNQKGMARFTGQKDQTYQVSIVSDQAWSMLQPIEIFLNKNKKIDMPLVKAERLTGSIHYSAGKYSQITPQLSGIQVHAVADNGMIYKTRTMGNGSFSFYLPENTYTVYVDTEGQSFSIADPKKNVVIKRNTNMTLSFNYLDKTNKVEVTKF